MRFSTFFRNHNSERPLHFLNVFTLSEMCRTRYFGFTTGEPLCDFDPTDQNTEFQIRYYGNGKYDLLFSNNQRYGWLYAHPSSDSVTVAPSQCYWYIIKNANGKYTIALADDPTKVLTVVHVTALNQMQVKLQTLGSVSSSLQEWEIINYSAHIFLCQVGTKKILKFLRKVHGSYLAPWTSAIISRKGP